MQRDALFRCRPGDLAIFIKAANPENIGRIVKVVRLASSTERPWRDEPGPAWIVTSREPLVALRKDGIREFRRNGPAFDHYLQPIRGNPRPADQSIEEVSHDHA